MKNEGCKLAESGDLRKALNIWRKAEISIQENEESWASNNSISTPCIRSVLHELKAQAYMELDMLIDAIRGFLKYSRSEKSIKSTL